MLRDAQEYINGLKTYNRYVYKAQSARKRHHEIEVILERMGSSSSSPGAVNMVEVTYYRKGEKKTKLVPVPKLDPDPNRNAVIRAGLIDQQCSLEKEIAYYERKIRQIKDFSETLPDDLRKLCWDVYVRKKIGKASNDRGYSKANIYRMIRSQLEEYF